MNLERFLKVQEQTYKEIRDLRVLDTGAKADVALQERRGGFFVSLIHASDITRNAARLSSKIAHIVPSITYQCEHIHTTVGRVIKEFGPHFYCDPDSETNRNVLALLGEIVKDAMTKLNTPYPKIIYTEYLTTRNSVIAIGAPNEWFTNFAEALVDISKQAGMEIAPPWGAHITVSRFTEKITKKELGGLSDLLRIYTPLGISIPVAVAIGYTFRRREEQKCRDLRETPGHFKPYIVFALSFRNTSL
ncbi:MAG: hypothetical protein A3C08_03225 [Candidatus Taylorbacteria bacterium RIFCSPHIGHO2_02_FULL_47_18]|nr:MAG: hypothetical protein A3C08_03225 [Candidatus Taylorbacteria bacterium RIFCSPHIGHO2_02_FULL_47_18]OHA45671.1 MAG: hypothetical protein A3H13_00200 [Candidatus Taylorbacteria bacterium RIFCSPLOWO2_12_FULL_48_11]